MSQDIVTTRRQLAQVSSALRQGKTLPAVQTVVGALRLILSTPLMKAEREELEKLIAEAVDYIGNDATIRQIYPIALTYEKGQEKDIYETLSELLGLLKEATVADGVAASEARKQAAIAKGQEHLDAQEYDDARAVFKEVAQEHPDDGTLKSDIGERMLNAGLYEDAADYLAEAVHLDPAALHNYNKLAIALRKLGRYDAAEEYYMKVVPLAPEDANLMFNIGRLYLEWERWDKAVAYGEKALAINPEFVEAGKLARFAKRKMEG